MTNEFKPKPTTPPIEPDPLDPSVPLDANKPVTQPVPNVAQISGIPPVPNVAQMSGIPPVPQVANRSSATTEEEDLGAAWAGAAPEADIEPGHTGKGEEAKAEAEALGRQGMESARQVATTATEEAGHVAQEAKQQTANLLGELSSDLREQAVLQQEKIAKNLRSISEEFRSMAESSSEQGTAVSWVRQAGQQAGGMADWLGDRDPGSLLSEVKSFARQRPGTFLALAAGAGLLAGRLARGVAGAESTADSSEDESAPEQAHRESTTSMAPPRQHTLGRENSGSGLRVNPVGEAKGYSTS